MKHCVKKMCCGGNAENIKEARLRLWTGNKTK
jgi:hypothetical protein